MFYVNDELQQGSAEWRLWRRGVIGASDAGTIMGENPWSSPEHLMKEKLGLIAEFQGNEATREGQRLEPHARRQLQRSHGTRIRATVVQDSETPFLAASLDGLNEQHTALYEIKCGKKAYQLTSRSRSVPTYYQAQLQHMMMITGLDSIFFAAFRPDEPLVVLKVGRNGRYIKTLRSTEEKFASALSKRGHQLQTRFVGIQVS